MRKIKNLIIEGVQFPIATLLIAMLLIGIGTTFNPSNQFLVQILSVCTYVGGYIKQLFPIILIVGVLSKTQKPAMTIVSGLSMYFTILIITMFFSSTTYESYFYTSLFGLSVNIKDTVTNAVATHYPLNTGFISPIIVIIAVRFIYKRIDNRSNYSITSFISNDTICFIESLLFGVVIGIGISITYKYFVVGVKDLMGYISEYSTRFRGMFVYASTERLFDITGFSDIYKGAFWLGAQGGNWADVYGNIYNGDINVWAAQVANKSVELGFGKYITPYYAINLFVMPTIVIFYYCMTQNKIDRTKNIGLVLVAIATSIISSSLLPIELVVLFNTPLFMFVHSFLSGLISAVLFKLNIQIGYTFSKVVLYALPGSLVSFIENSKFAIKENAVLVECIVGIAMAIIYCLILIIYYNFFALKPFNKKKRVIVVKEVEKALGGIENIKYISSSAMGIHFIVFDEEKVNFEQLFIMNFFDIKSVRYGFKMNYGPESCMLVKEIKKDMSKIKTNVEYNIA